MSDTHEATNAEENQFLSWLLRQVFLEALERKDPTRFIGRSPEELVKELAAVGIQKSPDEIRAFLQRTLN